METGLWKTLEGMNKDFKHKLLGLPFLHKFIIGCVGTFNFLANMYNLKHQAILFISFGARTLQFDRQATNRFWERAQRFLQAFDRQKSAILKEFDFLEGLLTRGWGFLLAYILVAISRHLCGLSFGNSCRGAAIRHLLLGKYDEEPMEFLAIEEAEWIRIFDQSCYAILVGCATDSLSWWLGAGRPAYCWKGTWRSVVSIT